MKDLDVKLFLFIGFLLGTWGALFEGLQVAIIGVALLFNLVKYRKDFYQLLRRYKYYLLIPVVVMAYAAVHAFFIIQGGRYMDFKPSFGVFEKLALAFLLVVVYVVSCRFFIDLKILKRFLLYFCVGVFLFNFLMLFHVAGWDLLKTPGKAVAYLYNSRFGFTKYFLGGRVYLDAEAMHIYIAALIAYAWGMISTNIGKKVLGVAAFLIFAWFLSLTVTKSSILGFLCGFVLLNGYFLVRLSGRYRWGLLGVLLLLVAGAYIFRPANFDRRWEQVEREIEDVREGRLEGGGSITPRVVFYKTCFDHIGEWGVWGLGVYTERVSQQWYRDSGNTTVAALTHSHNSFLQYWMWLGIVGLCFILSWFFLPVIRMLRSKCYSFLALSIIVALFVDCQFEVQLVVNDALPVVVFFLALFYVFYDRFAELEGNIS